MTVRDIVTIGTRRLSALHRNGDDGVGENSLSDVMIVSNDVALMLVEQYGRGALDYVDEQIKAARECDDWHKLRAWYEVGDEVDKLLNRVVQSQDDSGGREAEASEHIGADECGAEDATPEYNRPRIKRPKAHKQAG